VIERSGNLCCVVIEIGGRPVWSPFGPEPRRLIGRAKHSYSAARFCRRYRSIGMTFGDLNQRRSPGLRLALTHAGRSSSGSVHCRRQSSSGWSSLVIITA
jgi:hypothetical protein